MTQGRGLRLLVVGLALGIAFVGYGGPAMQVALFDLAVLCR